MANAFIVNPVAIPAWITNTYVVGGQLAYLTNDYAGVGVTLAAGGFTYVYISPDLGVDREIDFIGIFGLDGVPAGATGQVFYATSAQGPFTGVSANYSLSAALAGTEPLSSGKTVGWLSPPATITARYLQITIYVPAGTTCLMSRLVIGKRILLERNFGFGATFGVRDLGSLDFSRRGVLQRARGKKMRTVGLTFSSVRKDEVETQTKPLLEQVGNTEMVALVTDPSVHAQRSNRCYFGPLVGDLSHTWRKADLFEAKTSLVSIF